jgi:holo-[acyl-carrier protein] synthase
LACDGLSRVTSAIVWRVVVGLGVDVAEIDRVERALDRWGERLVARLMDPEEAARLPAARAERARALALAIAGKEAASKAIGTGWTRGVRWRDVVVSHDPPRIELRARALERARRLGSTGQGTLRFELRGNLVLGEFRLVS